MKLSVLLLIFVFLGCATRHPIEDAKAVIKSHEEFAKAGNLDGVVGNMADDIVGFVPGMLLIKGKEAFRDFYSGMFKMGKSEFTHEYHSTDIFGDAVVLCGFAHGTLTKSDSTTAPLANNFILILKYQPDGKIKFWRTAFTPSSQ